MVWVTRSRELVLRLRTFALGNAIRKDLANGQPNTGNL